MCKELSKDGDLSLTDAPVFCQKHAEVGAEQFRNGFKCSQSKKKKRDRKESSEESSEEFAGGRV